jgi:uncharacterized protein (TIGR03382 family)
MASCGEFASRKCGINGNMCRQRQNSVALLEQRLGPRGGGAGRDDGSVTDRDSTAGPGMTGGCAAAGGSAGAAMALAFLGAIRRRRR